MFVISLQYERLPHFLIKQISDELDLDDRINFMKTSLYVFNLLKSSFGKFTYMLISDDPSQNLVESDEGQFLFSGPYLIELLQLCTDLEEVSIIIRPQSENLTNCPIFESSLYHPRGYIGKFCKIAPPSLLNSLNSISLNVYLSVISFSYLQMRCPTEDLFFSAEYLAKYEFKTFIQIDFCALFYSYNDWYVNFTYMCDMHLLCEKMKLMGCKADVDIVPGESCGDLLIETGNLEYLFTYFYHNGT